MIPIQVVKRMQQTRTEQKERQMTTLNDQCKNCICRGDEEWCATTPCSIRVSWFAQVQGARIAELEGQLLKARSTLTDRKDGLAHREDHKGWEYRIPDRA